MSNLTVNCNMPEPVQQEGEDVASYLSRMREHTRTATYNCDVPYCESEPETLCPRNNNVLCWTCKKFCCKNCCSHIYKGTWNGEEFYKPKLIIPGMVHQIWKCPHCRASFDRITHE